MLIVFFSEYTDDIIMLCVVGCQLRVIVHRRRYCTVVTVILLMTEVQLAWTSLLHCEVLVVFTCRRRRRWFCHLLWIY